MFFAFYNVKNIVHVLVQGYRERAAGSQAAAKGGVVSIIYRELQEFLAGGVRNTWAYLSDSPLFGLSICDNTGVVIHVNDLHEYISGKKAEDVVGINMAEQVRLGNVDRSTTFEVLKCKHSILWEQNRPGREYIVKADPVFDDKGEIAYVVNLLLDVSLERALKSHLEQTREDNALMQRRLEELQRKLDASRENGMREGEQHLLYVSKQMRDVHAQIRYIANSSSVVLITGESGVGKELVAKTIQQTSDRRDKPFISINCAAVPSELLEAELFGYEGGAFTSSRPGGKAGLFESVQNGTIFLDEIGEMPRKLQAKMLRVLQEKEIRRVGSTKTSPIDVRIIAATNQNLKELIERGQFREDLYYRLNVIPIRIPPLRERRDDVPVLAYSFLDAFNKKYGKDKHISQDGYNYLVTLPYQGNVRQLENTIERLVLLCQEDLLLPEDIAYFYSMTDGAQGEAGHMPENGLPSPLFSGRGLPGEDEGTPWKQRVKNEEEQMMCDLAAKGLSTYQIARKLGLNQSTVWRKLKKKQGGG
jgi:transcriptional regulator with PAS, ATPase and Fis domain